MKLEMSAETINHYLHSLGTARARPAAAVAQQRELRVERLPHTAAAARAAADLLGT